MCIDGFGAGNELSVRNHDKPTRFGGMYFRMDADVFAEAGISTVTVSTGLERVKMAGRFDEANFAVDEIEFARWRYLAPTLLGRMLVEEP